MGGRPGIRGAQPFGMEAQNCLRAEKGHVIIGTESEQRVTLLDIGMGFLWDRNDTSSSTRLALQHLRACADQQGRMKLVGFRGGGIGCDATGWRYRRGWKRHRRLCLHDSSLAIPSTVTYGMALVNDAYRCQGRGDQNLPGARQASR